MFRSTNSWGDGWTLTVSFSRRKQKAYMETIYWSGACNLLCEGKLLVSLTDGKIKYVWNFYTGEEELFDWSKDPGELRNLVSEKHYRKRLADLREAMVKIWVNGEKDLWKKGSWLFVKKDCSTARTIQSQRKLKPLETGGSRSILFLLSGFISIV